MTSKPSTPPKSPTIKLSDVAYYAALAWFTYDIVDTVFLIIERFRW